MTSEPSVPATSASRIDPLAGRLAPRCALIDVAKRVNAYFADRPDPGVAAQRVAFGTSGHRGSAFERSFNEWHVLAIAQAICDYRDGQGIDGPLCMGIDTHALSHPACASALEVLAANGVQTMLATGDEFTPTPAVSHAILVRNRQRSAGLADGIVITPSHNPPHDGGINYNPTHGGAAGQEVTGWIEAAANRYLESGLQGVRRMAHEKALCANTTQLIDRLAARLGRRRYEVPVGFKWFASGLQNGSLGYCGEESAGATFLRRDGTVWTTDKDGIAAALLSAEITARAGPGPGRLYEGLAREFGAPVADRREAAARVQQKKQRT